MTAEQEVLEAMRTFDGDVKIASLEKRIASRGGLVPADVGTTMADLTYPPTPSSGYSADRCFLFRTGRGIYRLRREWRIDPSVSVGRRATVSRKHFIEANGATCDNWTWSWSFVDHSRRIVIFGAWDMHTDGSRTLILTEHWLTSPKGKKSSGYPQSREHIRLVEEDGYALYTFPMMHSVRSVDDDESSPSVIDFFIPELSERVLAWVGPSWYACDGSAMGALTDEVDSAVTYAEGAVKKVTVNAFERSRQARAACIAHYGAVCAVCSLDFESVYGPIARGLIHVHHRRQLSEIGEAYQIDPIVDLVPVCPNCHAVIHLTRDPLEVEQLRELLHERALIAAT